MNNSAFTIQAVGLGACAEVLSRFCFPGLYSQKGVNPSLSVSLLFLGFKSNDLFTGVVAYYLFFVLLVLYYLYMCLSVSPEGHSLEIFPVSPEGHELFKSLPVSPWKTGPNHQADLWINPLLRKDRS